MQCIVLTTSGDQTIITLSNDEKKLNQVLVSLWVALNITFAILKMF